MSMGKIALSRLRVLYVEDDVNIKTELTLLLSKFFKNMITASNGQEGFDLFTKNRNSIDLIISDINMPVMTGIEMIKAIRETDKKIPCIFTTAYSDNDFLVEAIKLKVYEYIIKPIDIRKLISVVNDIALILYNEFLVKQKTKELENYKYVIDKNNIVIKTDTKMKITYVNDLFIDISGYEKDELLGKEFSFLKHKDIDPAVLTEIYAKVLSNKAWKGQLKFNTKDEFYIAETYVIATLNDSGKISGTICMQRDLTSDINKKRDMQVALMKEKGDIFIRSKEDNAEQTILIKDLTSKLVEKDEQINQIIVDRDKYLFGFEKLRKDFKRVKRDLEYYKNNSLTTDEQSSMTLKTNKENTDLRLELKRLSAKLENQIQEHEKELYQKKINFETQMDELEKEVEEYRIKITELGNIEVVNQKIEYWKEKARSEAKRAEEIERKIVQSNDKSLIDKFFGKIK